jgi:thymidine kinase
MSGECHVIVGCMFAGKSTELLRRLKRYQLANRTTLLLKHSVDQRYSVDKVVTHDREEREARVVSELSQALVAEVASDSCEVIGIDEGQFFHGLDKACRVWVEAGKIVMVAMLDADYTGHLFPGSPLGELTALSDTIVKLTAICYQCGKEATLTKLMEVSDMGSDHVKVGGKGIYQPCCRACHQ